MRKIRKVQHTCYTGQYGAAFVSGSEADTADKRIAAIHGEMLPQLLPAPTPEDFETLWAQYVSRWAEAGLALLLEEGTRQTNEAKARLGLT